MTMTPHHTTPHHTAVIFIEILRSANSQVKYQSPFVTFIEIRTFSLFFGNSY
jgi:hypothetical protein